jgi:hypothetical protein
MAGRFNASAIGDRSMPVLTAGSSWRSSCWSPASLQDRRRAAALLRGDVYQGAATPVTALLSFVPKTSGFVALIKLLFTVTGGAVGARRTFCRSCCGSWPCSR